MKKILCIAVMAGAVAAAPAVAQSTGQTEKPAATKTQTKKQAAKPAAKTAEPMGGTLAPADRTFVREAATGGLAEVELGNLAKEKASNADVKQFGDRMVTDHSKANDELKQWAQQKNVTLPTELDARTKATRDRLSKLSGEAFDKAYMAAMVTDHQKDVAAFQRESKMAKDADLKTWAGKTLPTLEDHLKLARETRSKVAGATATSGKKGPAKKGPGKKHPGR